MRRLNRLGVETIGDLLCLVPLGPLLGWKRGDVAGALGGLAGTLGLGVEGDRLLPLTQQPAQLLPGREQLLQVRSLTALVHEFDGRGDGQGINIGQKGVKIRCRRAALSIMRCSKRRS